MLYIGRDWSSTRMVDIKSQLKGVQISQLLDVGCAGGELTRELEGCADEILAIDPWEERIATALDAPQSDSIRYEVCRTDDLPDNSADVVTCLEVLEHMPPPQASSFLADLFRVLRPGGQLLLTTPNRLSLQRRLGLRVLRGESQYPTYPYEATPGEDDYHWYEYDRGELHALIEGVGFTVEKLGGDHVSIHRIRGLGRYSLIAGSRWLAAVMPGLAKHHIVTARKAA